MESKSLKKFLRAECKGGSKSVAKQMESQPGRHADAPGGSQLGSFLYQHHEEIDSMIGRIIRQAVFDCLSSTENKMMLRSLTDRCKVVDRHVTEFNSIERSIPVSNVPLQRSKSSNFSKPHSMPNSAKEPKNNSGLHKPSLTQRDWNGSQTFIERANIYAIDQHLKEVTQKIDHLKVTFHRIAETSQEMKETIKNISSRQVQRTNEICSFSNFNSGEKPLSSIKKTDGNCFDDTLNQENCVKSQLDENNSPDSRNEDSSEATVYLVCNTQLELFFENGDPLIVGEELNQVRLSSEQFEQIKDQYFFVK